MSRRLVSVTLDNVDDLPRRCRACVFWELAPSAGGRAGDAGGSALEKEAWLSDTLLGWGGCGLLCYVDGRPAGYAMFAPPAYVPRSGAFPTSPVSPDAILLTTARVAPEHRAGGIGRMLAQGVVREVARRGAKAVEAFGTIGGDDGTGDGGDGLRCLLPAGYLRAVGFKTVRAHPRTPRLRLEIKSTVTWREDVESALERLLASIGQPTLVRG